MFQLNLFNTGTPDENIIRNERRSTRLYLFFLIISIVILTIYYSAISYTQTNTIQSPTFTKYSNLIQKISLKCPCSSIAIKYDKFIQIKPHYHEVCQSDFVSNEWINHLLTLYEQSWNKSNLSDFRRIGVFQFQTIRSLCQLANDTIENNLQSLNYTDFIQSQLIPKELFQAQINSFIENFIKITPKTFMRTLRFVQDTTAQSLFMTGASMTSVRPVVQYKINTVGNMVPYSGINYTFINGSSCVCSSSTATTCMGPATFNNEIVPGFQTGCYMLSALMNSTLEAFHNQTFIDILSSSAEIFQKLNSSNSDSKVDTLLSRMFVNFWSNSTSYEKYFEQCAPDSCQYITTQYHNFWAIVLLLIGLFGGLSSVLKIITPILIVNIWPFIWKSIFRRYGYTTQVATAESTPVRSLSMRMKMLFQLNKRKLVELNLFRSIPPSQDETVLRQQRHQTRVYLILLVIGLLVLTVFISTKPYTIIVIRNSPSLETFTDLYEQYPLTLNCPCSQTTLEYNQFISFLKPQYHPICLSEFISPLWINVQFIKSPVEILPTNDIRYQSQIHFQLLSTLCHMANQTIEENLELFYRTKFVTNQTLDSSSFHTKVNLIFDQFVRTAPESYQRILQLIQTNAEVNQFIVPLNSEFKRMWKNNINLYVIFKPALNERIHDPACKSSEGCICVNMTVNECVRRTMIVKPSRTIRIPGMYQIRLPLQSVLMSTLECFYNDTCLSQITRLIDPALSSNNFSILQLSLLSLNDSPYDTIDKLANKVFIQSWKNRSSYQSYFNHCHPLTCQYTYESRFNIIYIITTIIGLIGGLDIALRLLIPFMIKHIPQIWKNAIRRKRNAVVPGEEASSIKPTFRDRLRILIGSMKKKIIELNLFPSIPPSQDDKIIRRGRQTTRIYLILLLLSIFILAIYTSLTQETITVIKNSPSKSDYSELFSRYPLTLQCPCSRTGMKYDKFISQFEPQYHPICSSVFVLSAWSKGMYSVNSVYNVYYTDDDFRLYAQTQFETVSKLCSLSQNILNSSLLIWFQTDFATARVISQTEFDIQIEKSMEEFKRKIANQFKETMKLIQITNYANELATIRLSNWKFLVNSIQSSDILSDILNVLLYADDSQTVLQVLALPQTYGEDNCSCILQSNCSKLSSIPVRTSNQSLKQNLPGFRIGCLPLDALFQSTFSCLYNQTCLDLMRSAIYYSKPIPAEILIESSLTSTNTTIETYLRELFVLQWFKNTSFDRYFNECAPQSCQYSYTMKFNVFYFVTTILALFGGLTEGLHFTLSCLSTIVIKLYDRRKKKQVISFSQQPNNPVVDVENETVQVDPIPPTITVIIPPIEEQNILTKNYKERAVMICLCLLAIVAIVTVPVLWLRNDNTAYISMNISTITTMMTSITRAESATARTNICLMTLVYQPITYSIGLGGKSMVVGDFNKDSIQDLAVTNYDDHTISVLFGNGNGTFEIQQVYPTGNETYPWGIKSGYFNNDTFLDLAVTLSVSNKIAIFFGSAINDSFTTLPYTFTISTSSVAEDGQFGDILNAIDAADLNNDELTDLVVGGHYPYWESVESLDIVFNLGDGRPNPYTCSHCYDLLQIDSIVIGDFDNDGKQNDISVCNLNSYVTTLSSITFDGDIIATFNTVKNHLYEKAHSMIRGTFNDDNLDDLALVSSQSDTLQVLLAYGDGTFTQQIYSTDRYPTSVARISFNNDSLDDLAVLTCNQTINIYLGTKIGIFRRNDISFYTGEMNTNDCAHSLRAADLNEDGKDDLVFIDPEAQSVRTLLSTTCTEYN